MKYNKGEWSEAYAFVKLIANGYVFASDENLNEIPDKLYPILKVFKDEIEKYYETNSKKGIINIVNYDGEIISSLKSSLFLDIANKSLEIIKNSKGRSFEVPIMKNFLNDIGIDNFKGSSAKKEDIKMEIFDSEMDKSDILTFSVKSELGSKPTILNASKLTNFTFEIKGMSNEDFVDLNSINKEIDKKWLKTKFNSIFNSYENGDYEISLFNEENNILYQNLRLIDSNLPKMIGFMLFYFYSHEKSADIQFLTSKLVENNPLDLEDEEKSIFYKKKMSEFIEAVTFGMMPNMKWDGNYEISGGLLTVKKDGDIVCHHIFYDNIALKNYLFKHTKLESPSTSRHEYGQLYKENNKIFFKLNLQLRFK
jgi:hypothetical protein